VSRVRSVERLPIEEERVRAVRPMDEGDLLDVVEMSAVPAAGGDNTVPYAAPKEAANGVTTVRRVEPLKDDTIAYSGHTQSIRKSSLKI